MRLSGCQGEVLRRARIDRDRRADDIQEVQLDRDHMHDGRPSAKTRERAEIKKNPPKRVWIRMAPRVGFEPTTYRLTAECSAVELPRNMVGVTRFELVTSSV